MCREVSEGARMCREVSEGARMRREVSEGARMRREVGVCDKNLVIHGEGGNGGEVGLAPHPEGVLLAGHAVGQQHGARRLQVQVGGTQVTLQLRHQLPCKGTTQISQQSASVFCHEELLQMRVSACVCVVYVCACVRACVCVIK